MDLLIAFDYYFLGILDDENLPGIAQDAIQEGYESELLYELASVTKINAWEVDDLLRKILIELSIKQKSKTEAAVSIVKHISEDMLNKKILPYDGAKKIWTDVIHCFEGDEVDNLLVFSGLASEYEDFMQEENLKDYGINESAAYKMEIENSILIEAKKIINDRADNTQLGK